MATLEELKKWATLPDNEWVAVHVPRYKEVRPNYIAYEQFLKTVMKRMCARLAPLAIIDARAKTIPSFAEKILRKRALYIDPKDPADPDPLLRMTDLCGGRIIAQTAGQVAAVCQFIEQAFDIDRANSEDVSRRLRPTEFGYRSVHYIIMVSEPRLRAAGIDEPIPRELVEPVPLKAEIQVRTLLEHAWSDIGHDMTYKTELKVPASMSRDCAILAAELEHVDRAFAALVSGLAEFRTNIGAYHPRSQVEDEIARLRIVLGQAPENVDLAAKAAQMALCIGRHEEALEILKPYEGQPHQAVQRIRGVALTEMHWDNPRSPDYAAGHGLLMAACEHAQKDAETLCTLAESWAHRDDVPRARAAFHDAVAVDPGEPAALSRYLVFEIAHNNNSTPVRLAAPMINNSMARCRRQIDARVNVPMAWASLAMFHLFSNQPFEALAAVAQVIRLCEPAPGAGPGGCGAPGRPCVAGRALLRIRRSLRQIDCIRGELAGFDWCERAALLGAATRLRNEEAINDLQAAALPGAAAMQREGGPAGAVILTGACAKHLEQMVEDRLKPALLAACEGLSFRLICGGTRSGVCRTAGDVAEQSAGRIQAYGYLPRLVPAEKVEVETNPRRYHLPHFYSAGNDFSPLDFLQAWTDLLSLGIEPRRVKVLCYGGGHVARAQCALALSLDAHVGIVQDDQLPEDRLFNDPDWQDHPRLVRLPLDAMTLRAFLLLEELPARKPEYEKAAKQVHESYLKSAMPRDTALGDWDHLPEDLKISNFHQVAYAANILRTAGLGVRPLTDPSRPLLDLKKVLELATVKRLAQMEHGRWNIERLLRGWRHATPKDMAKRHSPHLVPWTEVPEDVQEWDINAIYNLPAAFREAGLEVFQL